MKPITLLIADDHQLVREAWTMVLNNDPRFKVLATCGTAEAAVDAVDTLKPDIVLLDINLPGISGIEAVPLIRDAAPHSKIIGVSLHTQPKYFRQMMQEGANGYVTKDSSTAEMIAAIIAVHEGKKFVCDYIKEQIAEQFATEDKDSNKLDTLSTREFEIIELIKKGLSSKEIAKLLAISVKTVEVHRYNVLKKLNLKNSAALINFFHKHH